MQPDVTLRHNIWATRLQSYPGLVWRWFATLLITRVVAALPSAWVDAAVGAIVVHHQQGLPLPAMPEAVAKLVRYLGWQLPTGRWLAFCDLTVKTGTLLQLRQLRQQRSQRMVEFVTLAVAPPSAPPDADAVVRRLLSRLWAVNWENCHKEPFWRLVLNGLPTVARLHGLVSTCTCGQQPAGREHHYWACPIAHSVVGTVAASLASYQPAAPPLRLANIWLAQAPDGTRQDIWDVVCLAAVAAMDFGRRLAVHRHLAAPPSVASPFAVGAAPALLPAACSRAAARFWELLTDFAALPNPFGTIGPGHPFFYTALDGQRLMVQLP